MIPHELTLKNFLSYGATQQTIIFTPYKMICFSGKNGHGKSAILEALSWAVWGCARKTVAIAKADEGLIHLGASQMYVIFTFEVGGARYQIRREVVRDKGKVQTSLDFSLFDPELLQYRSLTDKTIRQTQERIIATVGLDYETFCNSVYLRQGNADQFSRKTPKERKEILSSILGLDVYERLERRAAEKVREVELRMAGERMLSDQHREALTQRDALEALYVAQEQRAGEHEVILQQRKLVVREAKEAADELQRHSKLIGAHYEEAVRYGELVREWRAAAARVRFLPDRSAVIARYEAARIEQERYQTLMRTTEVLARDQARAREARVAREHALQLELSRELALLREQWAQGESTVALLEKNHAAAISRLREGEREVERLREGCQRTAVLLRTRESEWELFTKEKAQFDKRRAFYTTYKREEGHLAEQREALRLQREPLLVPVGAATTCPTCAQTISSVKRAELLRSLTATYERIERKQGRIGSMLERLKAILISQKAELDAKMGLEAALKEAARVNQQEVSRLEHGRVSVAAAHAEVLRLEGELASARRLSEERREGCIRQEQQAAERIAGDQVLQQLTAVCARLEGELRDAERAALASADAEGAYQAAKKDHDQMLSAVAEGAVLSERRQVLQRLYNRLRTERAELRRLCGTLDVSECQIRATAAVAACATSEHELAEMMAAREKILGELGQLRERRAVLAEIAERLRKSEEVLEALEKERSALMFCVRAASKNGIPALLIEEALPEIESAANELLGRLTNYTASLFIESLRDLKKGGIRETLDIKIMDQCGVRPYEMFSGGEAFRIDFALRLALSQLLAKRAGTALQMLIIDEGFGSQDEEGLALLIDALALVRNDFEKILVVSHLPALKEHFPVHFCVEKKPTGSVVSIEERG